MFATCSRPNMKTANTPSPWTASETGIFSEHLNSHGNFYVAALPFPSEEPSEQEKANLRLMAASPEMLKLLQGVDDIWGISDARAEGAPDMLASKIRLLLNRLSAQS